MKKVLSFVLVLSLVLGSFSMAFAATPTDVVGKDCETAVQALSDLGVVSGYTDGTYKPENPVNRAEACKLIISALGLDAYAAGITATSFTDLDGYGWAVGYIGYAERLGLVKGVGNGKFNPGGPVTYEQWATMLVRALGYTDEVLPGAWPANYMIKAQSLGIMKNIKATGNAAANRGDVAIMLYNDLHQAIGTIDKDGVFQPNRGKYDPTNPEADANGYLADTMLSRLEKRASVDFAVFTDTALANVADGINLRSYLGANVKVYLNDDDDIIGIKDCNSTFLTGDLSDDCKTLTVGDVDYTVKKATDAAVIYKFVNGEKKGLVTFEGMSTLNDNDDVVLVGKVSGKTITEVYSIMRWRINADSTAKQFVAGDLNTNKNKLCTKEFEEDNNGNIDTTSFELLGVSSLDKIAEDNIVEVYTDGKYIRRVAVGTQVVEGEITKANRKMDKFTIGGTAYETADATMAKTGSDTPEVTAEGKAFLTYGGKIGYWDESDASAGNYAVVINAWSETKGTKTTSYVTLFNKEGKEVDYQLSEFDLKAKGAAAGTNVTVAAAAIKDSIVKFGLNSSGKIDSFTTFDNDQNISGYAENADGSIFAGTSVKSGVVVFVYDNDDDEWTLGSMKDISTDKDEKVGIGHAGTTKGSIWFVLDKGDVAALAVTDNASSSDASYGVLNGVGTISKNGDVYRTVSVLIDGVEKDLTTTIVEDGTWDEDFAAKGFATTTSGISTKAVSTTGAGLLKIKVNAEGEVTLIKVAVPGDLEDVFTIGGGYNFVKVNGTKITLENGGTEYAKAIDPNAIVYLYDADDDEWSVETVNALSTDNRVQLYKTSDTKKGFDAIIAWE